MSKEQTYLEWLESLRNPEDSTCPDCGGERIWCDTCEMWTQLCCEEYGTCECS